MPENLNDLKKDQHDKEVAQQPLAPTERVQIDLEKLREKREGKDVRIAALQEQVLKLEKELTTLGALQERTPQASEIHPKVPGGASESVAVAILSDLHSEEEVKPEQVGGMNEYNLDIFDRRFSQWCHGVLAWLAIEQAKTSIKTLILAILGDMISNSIHEELMESNLLLPVDAIYNAQNHLIGGIDFLLANTPNDMEFLIVCHSGNHGRFTKKQRISTEAGNSLEQYMYYSLRDHYRDNPRIKFQIADGYHTFTRLWDSYTIRWHHGHQINYQGGVGGITIPVNKAIAQWNKARPADLDVFGHFHTKFDGGNFLCNGSMIGYNAYAVSIKASYELPCQLFFLVNKKWNAKTMVAPIYLK